MELLLVLWMLCVTTVGITTICVVGTLVGIGLFILWDKDGL